jgi:hypothetical protein
VSRAVALLIATGALGALAPASAPAYSERSVGSPQQVAWVRSAAQRFVAAELADSAAAACAVLNAPLRGVVRGASCEARWSARLAKLSREPAERSRLGSDRHALSSARVVVRGNSATIELPSPLLHGQSRFVWSENCWMLAG